MWLMSVRPDKNANVLGSRLNISGDDWCPLCSGRQFQTAGSALEKAPCRMNFVGILLSSHVRHVYPQKQHLPTSRYSVTSDRFWTRNWRVPKSYCSCSCRSCCYLRVQKSIREGFLNTQRSAMKLCVHILADIAHRSFTYFLINE